MRPLLEAKAIVNTEVKKHEMQTPLQWVCYHADVCMEELG